MSKYKILIQDSKTNEIVHEEALTDRDSSARFTSGAVGYGAGFKCSLVSPETGDEARFQASVNLVEIGSKARKVSAVAAVAVAE